MRKSREVLNAPIVMGVTKEAEKTIRPTAANDPFLRTIKMVWSTKVYMEAYRIYRKEGIDAARNFLRETSVKTLQMAA